MYHLGVNQVFEETRSEKKKNLAVTLLTFFFLLAFMMVVGVWYMRVVTRRITVLCNFASKITQQGAAVYHKEQEEFNKLCAENIEADDSDAIGPLVYVFKNLVNSFTKNKEGKSFLLMKKDQQNLMKKYPQNKYNVKKDGVYKVRFREQIQKLKKKIEDFKIAEGTFQRRRKQSAYPFQIQPTQLQNLQNLQK